MDAERRRRGEHSSRTDSREFIAERLVESDAKELDAELGGSLKIGIRISDES